MPTQPYSLNAGAMYNKVKPGFGNSQADAARYQFGANADTAAASQLTDDTQPVGSAVKAVLQGLAIGNKGKADIATATAQDDYNNYVKQQTDYLTQLQTAQARVTNENNALDQTAMPMGMAVLQYGKDGDLSALRSNQQRLANNWAQQAGYQMNGFVPTENDPYSFTVNMTDPTDGASDTHTFNVSDLVGRAMKQNPEFGQAFAQQLGVNPDALSKKSETQKKVEEFDKLSGERGPQMAAALTGVKLPDNQDDQDTNDLYKGNVKDIAGLGASLRQAPQRDFSANQAINAFGQAMKNGDRTGAGATQLNDLKSTINTWAGGNLFNTAPLDLMGSNTVSLIQPLLKDLKPLSNSDLTFAQKQMAGKETSPAANVVLLSVAKAAAMRDADNFQTYTKGGKKGMVQAWVNDGTQSIQPYYEQAYKDVLGKLKAINGAGSAAPTAAGATAPAQAPASAQPSAAQSILSKYNIQ